MDKATVLIGYGANNIEMIAMVFRDLKEGLNFINTHLRHGINWRERNDGSWTCDVEEDDPIIDEVFTSYYNGCGGVYGFTLKEVPYATKLVPFDLD